MKKLKEFIHGNKEEMIEAFMSGNGEDRIIDETSSGFFLVDNEYIDNYAKIFGPVTYCVYSCLKRYSNNKTKLCYPAQETIGKKLGISRFTVMKHIKLLEKYNLIETKKGRMDGKYTNNVYNLLHKSKWKKPCPK